MLISLILTFAFSMSWAANGNVISEDETQAVIQKNRLDMGSAISLLTQDAGFRNDNAPLNIFYDYTYAIPDIDLPDGSLADTVVTVSDVATVGTITIDYDWDTDSYPGEGSFTVTSPDGTTLTIGAGQTDGHYTVELTGFSGESMAGDWTFAIHDSWGDGGHAVANATLNVDEPAAVPTVSLSDESFDFGDVPIILTAERVLTISNTGGGDLNISSITSSDAAFSSDQSAMVVPAFGSSDVTITFAPAAEQDYTADFIITSDAASSPDTVALSGGGVSIPTSGGPDVAGYEWISSFDEAGPAFSWIDTSGAVDADIAYGDDIRGTIDLPFSLRFYGSLYTQITATTNAWIGMGPSTNYSSSYWTNASIPNSSVPNNLIAPLWDDFKAGDSPGSTSSYQGTILYKTVGTEPNRQFVVIFADIVRSYGDTDGFTFEVILDEATSDITIQYLDITGNSLADNGVGATVGIEDADGADGLEVLYNGSPRLVYDGEAIQFVAPPAPAEAIIDLDIAEYNFGSVPVGGSASV
ncbi:MAG: choice-of-anchor D domain-containing protein, partial [Candidatus Marinimicrobia bacterium]|nr:choice-of-anchor D domain-containing protein [Candidatus Neomarinimicrobiota bacterium]